MGDAKLAACAAAMSGQAVSRGPAPCGKSKGFSKYCMCTCTSTHAQRQPDVERSFSLPAGPARGGTPGPPPRDGRSEAVRTQIVVAVTAESPCENRIMRAPLANTRCIFKLIEVLNIMTQGPAGLGLFICRPRGVGGRGRPGRCVGSQVNIVIACRPACQLFAGLNRALGRCVCNASYCSAGNHEPSKGE